jgi:tight adherence protein B
MTGFVLDGASGPAVWLAAGCAAGAVLLCLRSGAVDLATDLQPRLAGRRPVAVLCALGVGAMGVVALMAVAGASVVPLRLAGPGVVLGVGVGGVGLLRRASARRTVRRETAARVLEACDEIAGELSAGVAPGQALERAAGRWSALEPVAAAQRFGGSVPVALRALAVRPGASDLVLVAAAWQLTERSGAGLAEALASVADGLRQQQRTRRVVAAELASARATARLIAGLPVLTLATGSGIGSPIGFLFGTVAGLLCLLGGLVLGLLGLGWIEHIAVALEAET